MREEAEQTGSRVNLFKDEQGKTMLFFFFFVEIRINYKIISLYL